MARPSALAVSALAFAASTFPILAQSAQWRPVPVANAVPPRMGFTLTPWQNGELLLFGGDAANPAATEWSWNGVHWTPVTTPVPRRSLAAVARNDRDGSLWVFGGRDAANVPLSDTWRFANGVWTQLNPPTVPTGIALAMASEPATGGMVLVTVAASVQSTWRFSGGDWSLLDTAPLVGSVEPVAMLADTVRGELLLLVETISGPGQGALELQRLAGSVWQTLGSRAPVPVSLGFARGAFDPERARAVVVQQSTSGNQYTSEWDGLQFTPQSPTPMPYFALFGAMAFHAERHESVLVIGGPATPLQVWRWAPQPQPLSTPYGAPCVSPVFTLGLAPGDSPQPGASHRLLATGANSSALTLAVIGLSHVQNGGLPLPQPIPLGTLGCLLRVEALLVDFLGVGLPAQRLVMLPSTPALLGQRYDAQAIQFDGSGITDTSNGLEVQIGLPLPERTLLEPFASATLRDALASGDRWGNGSIALATIGGDGRHGSFDPSLGTQVAPGSFEVDTTNLTIPANRTLSGVAEQVTDGRFFFTDFVVPAGTTVRFVGAVPAQVFVRGAVDVQGTVSADAAPMPFYVPTSGPNAGQRVSLFNARSGAAQTAGQPGGAGGPGGGSGGAGGLECLGAGPIVAGGVVLTDGQPGEDVRVAAAHAYAGSAVGTGGRGSAMHPAAGTAAAASPVIPTLATFGYRRDFSPGGGGGGFALAGGTAVTPGIPPPATQQPNVGPIAAGGTPFPLFPLPGASGYASLQHFLAGGSGGGGGGSHTFSTTNLTSTDVFMAGHGGSGGGGALALRAGGPIALAGAITARGGEGVLIDGDEPGMTARDVFRGVSSPGGGGAGGSLLLQSGADVVIAGALDVRGGAGSFTANVATTLAPAAPTQIAVQARAGAGSPGFYRVEAAGPVTLTGSAFPAPAAANLGTLVDADARSGSRSVWLLPPASGLPFYVRYELVADVGGVPLLFSDDPAVSPLAADGSGPLHLRFQGARLDPLTGAVIPATLGPWRAQLKPGTGSLNVDRAQALRFDLVVDKTSGPVVVRELRIVWR